MELPDEPEACFLVKRTKKKRAITGCLQYLYLGGVNSGTAALSKVLAAHPSVVMDVGSSPDFGRPTRGFWTEGACSTRGARCSAADFI